LQAEGFIRRNERFVGKAQVGFLYVSLLTSSCNEFSCRGETVLKGSLAFFARLLLNINITVPTSPVDPLARRSMKNAANCVSQCELQDT